MYAWYYSGLLLQILWVNVLAPYVDEVFLAFWVEQFPIYLIAQTAYQIPPVADCVLCYVRAVVVSAERVSAVQCNLANVTFGQVFVHLVYDTQLCIGDCNSCQEYCECFLITRGW